MPYRIIAAMGKNAGIGYRGGLPWHCPKDMAHFARLTKGNGNNAVLMGRETWNSLKCNPLTGRDNIVLSRAPETVNISATGVKIAKSFNDAITLCDEAEYDDVWIIGGAQIYTQALSNKLCASCHLTIMPYNAVSDTYFPTSSLVNGWRQQSIYDIDTNNSVSCHVFVPKTHIS